MRRLFAGLSFLALLAGCETSPLGGRCVYSNDCDRRTTGMTARCVRAMNVSAPCGGGAMDYCICCPIGGDPTDPSYPMACRAAATTDTGPGTDATTDTGPSETGTTDTVIEDASDASDVATTDVVDSGSGCSCPAGQFCDTSGGGMQCAAQRPIGATCGDGGECQTGHCVDSVCCNSACTGAGLSCNVSPDFAGLCSPVASVDAGTE